MHREGDGPEKVSGRIGQRRTKKLEVVRSGVQKLTETNLYRLQLEVIIGVGGGNDC